MAAKTESKLGRRSSLSMPQQSSQNITSTTRTISHPSAKPKDPSQSRSSPATNKVKSLHSGHSNCETPSQKSMSFKRNSSNASSKARLESKSSRTCGTTKSDSYKSSHGDNNYSPRSSLSRNRSETCQKSTRIPVSKSKYTTEMKVPDNKSSHSSHAVSKSSHVFSDGAVLSVEEGSISEERMDRMIVESSRSGGRLPSRHSSRGSTIKDGGSRENFSRDNSAKRCVDLIINNEELVGVQVSLSKNILRSGSGRCLVGGLAEVSLDSSARETSAEEEYSGGQSDESPSRMTSSLRKSSNSTHRGLSSAMSDEVGRTRSYGIQNEEYGESARQSSSADIKNRDFANIVSDKGEGYSSHEDLESFNNSKKVDIISVSSPYDSHSDMYLDTDDTRIKELINECVRSMELKSQKIEDTCCRIQQDCAGDCKGDNQDWLCSSDASNTDMHEYYAWHSIKKPDYTEQNNHDTTGKDVVQYQVFQPTNNETVSNTIKNSRRQNGEIENENTYENLRNRKILTNKDLIPEGIINEQREHFTANMEGMCRNERADSNNENVTNCRRPNVSGKSSKTSQSIKSKRSNDLFEVAKHMKTHNEALYKYIRDQQETLNDSTSDRGHDHPKKVISASEQLQCPFKQKSDPVCVEYKINRPDVESSNKVKKSVRKGNKVIPDDCTQTSNESQNKVTFTQKTREQEALKFDDLVRCVYGRCNENIIAGVSPTVPPAPTVNHKSEQNSYGDLMNYVKKSMDKSEKTTNVLSQKQGNSKRRDICPEPGHVSLVTASPKSSNKDANKNTEHKIASIKISNSTNRTKISSPTKSIATSKVLGSSSHDSFVKEAIKSQEISTRSKSPDNSMVSLVAEIDGKKVATTNSSCKTLVDRSVSCCSLLQSQHTSSVNHDSQTDAESFPNLKDTSTQTENEDSTRADNVAQTNWSMSHIQKVMASQTEDVYFDKGQKDSSKSNKSQNVVPHPMTLTCHIRPDKNISKNKSKENYSDLSDSKKNKANIVSSDHDNDLLNSKTLSLKNTVNKDSPRRISSSDKKIKTKILIESKEKELADDAISEEIQKTELRKVDSEKISSDANKPWGQYSGICHSEPNITRRDKIQYDGELLEVATQTDVGFFFPINSQAKSIHDLPSTTFQRTAHLFSDVRSVASSSNFDTETTLTSVSKVNTEVSKVVSKRFDPSKCESFAKKIDRFCVGDSVTILNNANDFASGLRDRVNQISATVPSLAERHHPDLKDRISARKRAIRQVVLPDLKYAGYGITTNAYTHLDPNLTRVS